MICQEFSWMLKLQLPSLLLKEQKLNVSEDDFSSSWFSCCDGCYFMPPPQGKEGHYATNAPFLIGRHMKQSPEKISSFVIKVLEGHPQVEKATFSFPGFVNIFLKKSYWLKSLQDILTCKDSYGNDSALHEKKWKDFALSAVSSGCFVPQEDRSDVSCDPLAAKAINIEFVSVNPTGPLHPGHGRGAVFGDALANILKKVGKNVTKEYYINDAGHQAELLGRSVYWYYDLSSCKKVLPEDFYQGEYIQDIAKSLREVYGDTLEKKNQDKKYSSHLSDQKPGEEFWLPTVRGFAVNMCMEWIKKDLQVLKIHHDVFSSEKALQDKGAIHDTVNSLRNLGFVYEGFLDSPGEYGKSAQESHHYEEHSEEKLQGFNSKGSQKDLLSGQNSGKEKPLMIFRSSRWGDDHDRPLTKKDGCWTYFAGDITYHMDKIKRGFRHMIDVWGADHGGHVTRMEGAIKALDENSSLDVLLCQMVRFKSENSLIKMSKRSGNFITLREVAEAIGPDCFRFFMLTKKLDAHIDFDFAKVQEQTKDNPLFYIQYAHARCHSVLRAGRKIFGEETIQNWTELRHQKTKYSGKNPPENDVKNIVESHGDAVVLQEPLDFTDCFGESHHLFQAEDFEVLKILADFPRQLYRSAQALEPHRISNYLQDVAGAFHSLWRQGSGKERLRFLVPDDPEKSRKGLTLVKAVQQIIRSGLLALGVTPIKELSSSGEG